MTTLHRKYLLPVSAMAVVWLEASAARAGTRCVDLNLMRTDLARFTPWANPPQRVYTHLVGGDQKSPSDPLVNHISDFFDAGFNNGIDPRFSVAVAGAESTFGTMNTTWVQNNNPFGMKPRTHVYPSLVNAIERNATLIDDFEIMGCLHIPDYVTPMCPYCTEGCQNWVHDVTGHYGGFFPFNLGGDPNPATQDLTFPADGLCDFGDCNGNGVTDVSDLLTLARVALGQLPVSACLAGADDSNCRGAAGSSGMRTARGTCGRIGIVQLLRGISIAVNGPAPLPTPVYTPEPDPCDGCISPTTGQYDCSNCQPTCGSGNCTFCESSCADACAACINPQSQDYDCQRCPCGNADCPFCDSCATPTPVPSPTPDLCTTCTCDDCFSSGCYDATGQECSLCDSCPSPTPSPTPTPTPACTFTFQDCSPSNHCEAPINEILSGCPCDVLTLGVDITPASAAGGVDLATRVGTAYPVVCGGQPCPQGHFRVVEVLDGFCENPNCQSVDIRVSDTDGQFICGRAIQMSVGGFGSCDRLCSTSTAAAEIDYCYSLGGNVNFCAIALTPQTYADGCVAFANEPPFIGTDCPGAPPPPAFFSALESSNAAGLITVRWNAAGQEIRGR